jgi:chemotaxis protein histidine kinase CheA
MSPPVPAAPDPVLIGIFETEVSEGVVTFHEHLLQIEQQAADGPRRLEDLLRISHDLKGSARVVGYEHVARLAHALEHQLLGWRRRARIEFHEIDLALRSSDVLRDLAHQPADATLAQRAEQRIAELEAPAAGADGEQRAAAAPGGPVALVPSHARPPVTAGASPDTAAASTGPAAPAVSVPAGLDPVAAPRGESLRIARTSIEAVVEDVAMTLFNNQRATEHSEELAGALSALEAVRLPGAGAGAREVTRASGELRAAMTRLRVSTNALRDTLRHAWSNVRTLDDHARALCLVPVAPLVVHLERVVRDAAAALQRRVELHVQGRDLHVDMAVAEALKAPLTHVLRNAVDHGLESPAERRLAGKPEAGALRLSFAEEGDRLVVCVADDGRGIDRAAVRARLGERALGADDRQLLQLLLRSGLSTREQVTQLSGRGIGLGTLAVVADQLRGDVELESEAGRGTEFTLQLPLRLSLVEGLVVEAGGCAYVLPLSGLSSDAGDAALSTSLAGLLGHASGVQPACVVSLRGREGPVSIAVDAVRDRIEVVRRSVGAHLGRVAFAEGATILPGGQPAFILDARALAAACGRRAAERHAPGGGAPVRRAPGPVARRRVLLVDDSATLRAKLKADLDAAGFQVVLAEDGLIALERLAAQHCDAIVSDVQMPRHDGFQLLERTAAQLPVVLMTAWPDEVAAQRAKDLGAVAYLPKDHQLAERVLAALHSALPFPQESLP